MMGSILGRIVKEVSLANYADDTPLSEKIDHTLSQAIPGDVYEWFMGEVAPPPLSNTQGKKLLSWLFKNIRKAELDLNHIRLIRQARREQFIEVIKDHLPTPATMTHVTDAHLEAYQLEDCIKEQLIPYLAKVVKRDEQSITVAMSWAIKAAAIGTEDLHWMLRYCKPVNEYQQLLLIE